MSAPRRIHVCGGDIVALAAAIAFKRALPRADVTLIGSRNETVHQKYGAAGPVLAEFHRKIGLQPDIFERATRAIAVRGSMFENWIEVGQNFFVPEAANIPFADGAALHQLWLRRQGSHDQCGLGRLLADRDAEPGYRFDALAYRDLLVRMAAAIGVTRAGPAEPGSATLRLDCETSVLPRGDWESWADHCPAFEENALSEEGKVDRPDEWISIESGMLRCRAGPHLASFASTSRQSGRLGQPWTDNQVAIGRAAIDLPPLMGLPLSAALSDILRIIRFIPPVDGWEEIRQEYNRQTTATHGALLDWASAPFSLLRAASDRSCGLAHIAEQFSHRGRVPLREHDPVSTGQWTAMLSGCGIRPRRIDPTALVLGDDAADQMIARAAATL